MKTDHEPVRTPIRTIAQHKVDMQRALTLSRVNQRTEGIPAVRESLKISSWLFGTHEYITNPNHNHSTEEKED